MGSDAYDGLPNERGSAMKRTVPISFCIWMSLVFCVLSQAGSQPLPGIVGPLSDSARLKFEGNMTFTTGEIRQSLMRAPEFLLASHPAAPPRDYLPTVKTLVGVGYQQCGV